MLNDRNGKIYHGFDYDDVVVKTDALKRRVSKEKYPRKITPPKGMFRRDLVVSDEAKSDPQWFSSLEYDHIKEIVFKDRVIGLILEEMKGALTTILALHEEGNGVIIISNRRPIAAEIAKKWFELRGIKNVPFFTVIGGEHKTETVKGLPLSSYTDNDVENLDPLIGHIPHLFLMTTQHNAKRELPAGIVRVKNWTELHERLKEIKQ